MNLGFEMYQKKMEKKHHYVYLVQVLFDG